MADTTSNGHMTTWLGNLRNRGVAARGAILAIVAAAALAMVAPVAWRLGGAAGVAAATLAASLCLAGAVLALLAGHRLREPRQAGTALLAAMAARTGIPLAAALVIHLRGGLLADAGLLYYLLVFYPVTLTAETLLSLPPSRAGHPANAVADTKSNNGY